MMVPWVVIKKLMAVTKTDVAPADTSNNIWDLCPEVSSLMNNLNPKLVYKNPEISLAVRKTPLKLFD